MTKNHNNLFKSEVAHLTGEDLNEREIVRELPNRFSIEFIYFLEAMRKDCQTVKNSHGRMQLKLIKIFEHLRLIY